MDQPMVLDTVALRDRLQAIRARHPAADPDAVADVVRAVLGTLQGDLSPSDASLLSQVEELGRTIAAAKAEVAALAIDDINASQIPLATDELDAIVAHTAAATDSILEVCETLDRVGGELAAAADTERAAALQDATTRIYEACGFQDITGQRITKVVGALKTIELKVSQILGTFGTRERDPAFRPVAPTPADQLVAGSLLHGPQLPATAMDQTDIDKLLASFD